MKKLVSTMLALSMMAAPVGVMAHADSSGTVKTVCAGENCYSVETKKSHKLRNFVIAGAVVTAVAAVAAHKYLNTKCDGVEEGNNLYGICEANKEAAEKTEKLKEAAKVAFTAKLKTIKEAIRLIKENLAELRSAEQEADDVKVAESASNATITDSGNGVSVENVSMVVGNVTEVAQVENVSMVGGNVTAGAQVGNVSMVGGNVTEVVEADNVPMVGGNVTEVVEADNVPMVGGNVTEVAQVGNVSLADSEASKNAAEEGIFSTVKAIASIIYRETKSLLRDIFYRENADAEVKQQAESSLTDSGAQNNTQVEGSLTDSGAQNNTQVEGSLPDGDNSDDTPGEVE